MLSGRILGIREKVERLAQTPGCETWFGADKHRFRLRPPVPPEELEAFERRHGVALPEDYREFLLSAGDGGAGPYYGIEPLSNWAGWFEEEAETPGFLAAPCPLADGPSLRQAWRAALERDAGRARGVLTPGAAPSQAWKEHLAPAWAEWGKGTVNLCDQGCTYSARLIVSGEARGRIVYFDAQLWRPPYFVRDANFIDWYERWLAEALSGRQPVWFGFDDPDERG